MKKLILLFLSTLFSISANAQIFNLGNTTVKMIIPFAPGGGTDVSFKHFQKYAEEKHNITVVPVYKPGAETVIGMTELADSKTDGLTLGFTTIASLATFKNKNPEYQFDYITMTSKPIMAVVANINSNIKNLNDLENEIKSTKITKSFAFGAPAQKIAVQQLFTINKVDIPELIPYKGANPLVTDLLGNHINVAVVPLTLVKSHIDNKKITLIATTSKNGSYSIYKRYPSWEAHDGYAVVLPKNSRNEVLTYWAQIFNQYVSENSTVDFFKNEFLDTVPFGATFVKQNVDSALKTIK